MFRLQNSAQKGASVKRFKPRRLEEHDLGDVLHIPSDQDISLEGDDIARNGNLAELVGHVPDDSLFIIAKDELVNELVRAEQQCGLEDEFGTCMGKPSVVLVVDEVVLQDVESKAYGDAVEVVHEASDIIIRYNDGVTCLCETHGKHGSGGHLKYFLWLNDEQDRMYNDGAG